jgi:hypothetical protein
MLREVVQAVAKFLKLLISVIKTFFCITDGDAE